MSAASRPFLILGPLVATVKYTTRDTLFRKLNFVTFGRKGAFSAGDFTLYTSSRIHIGRTTETIARKAAALFVLLWLRGVSASLADKLMDGFIIVLERQENKSLTFLAEIAGQGGDRYFRLTREGLCAQVPFTFRTEERIIQALDPQPDEEIIVTFTKRPKSGPARALDTSTTVSEH